MVSSPEHLCAHKESTKLEIRLFHRFFATASTQHPVSALQNVALLIKSVLLSPLELLPSGLIKPQIEAPYSYITTLIVADTIYGLQMDEDMLNTTHIQHSIRLFHQCRFLENDAKALANTAFLSKISLFYSIC